MQRAVSWLSVLVVVPALASAASAQEGSTDRAADDARINRAVVRALQEGVKLFNERGDAAGCHRVYQGYLIALGPFLDSRPEQAKAVQEALNLAATRDTPTEAAFTLRDALDRLYEATKSAPAPTPAPVPDEKPKPLWDRLGGQTAVEAVVEDFVAMAAADPAVDFFRSGRYPITEEGVAHLKKMLVELISSTTGGPLPYTGRGMKEVHEGMNITAAEFDALAGDLVAVLKSHNVPQPEIDELVAIIAGTKAEIVEVP